MGNVICCKVLCREDQKTNGPLKYQNVISDTKTKDQFLPKVLRERIRSEAVGVFPGRGACLSESLSPSGRRPLRKATKGGPWDTVHGCSCLPCQLNVRHIFKRQFLVYWEKGTFHTPGFLPRTLFLCFSRVNSLAGGLSLWHAWEGPCVPGSKQTSPLSRLWWVGRHPPVKDETFERLRGPSPP